MSLSDAALACDSCAAIGETCDRDQDSYPDLPGRPSECGAAIGRRIRATAHNSDLFAFLPLAG